jgi:hypothetical protein
MRTFYVIKNFTSETFISINYKWEGWNLCMEFETKQDAINYGIENSLGLCIIQEVIDL